MKVCLQSKASLRGPEIQENQDMYTFVFISIRSSESEGVDNAHHHYVSNSGDNGDPEPDGVAGHGLRLILLTLYGPSQGRGVDAGRGVEERVLAAVVIVG